MSFSACRRLLLAPIALLFVIPVTTSYGQGTSSGQMTAGPPELPPPAAAVGNKRKSRLEFLNDLSEGAAAKAARAKKGGQLPTEGEIFLEQANQFFSSLEPSKDSPAPSPNTDHLQGDGLPIRPSAQDLLRKLPQTQQSPSRNRVPSLGNQPQTPPTRGHKLTGPPKAFRDRQAIDWAGLLPQLIEKEIILSQYPDVLKQMVLSNPGRYGRKVLISPFPRPNPTTPQTTSLPPQLPGPAPTNQPPINNGPSSDDPMPDYSPGQTSLWPGSAAVAPYNPKPLSKLGQPVTHYLELDDDEPNSDLAAQRRQAREELKKAATGSRPVTDLAQLHDIPDGPLKDLVMNEALGALHRDAEEMRQRKAWGDKQVADWKWIQEAFPQLTPAQQWSRFVWLVSRWPSEYGTEILIPHLNPTPYQPVAQVEPLNHGPTATFPGDSAPLTNFILPDGTPLNPDAVSQPPQKLQYIAPSSEPAPMFVDSGPVRESEYAPVATTRTTVVTAPPRVVRKRPVARAAAATAVVAVAKPARPIRPVVAVVEPVPVVRRAPVARTVVTTARVVRATRPRVVAPVRNTVRRATTRGVVRRGRGLR